jgi:hypothetical protein
MASKTALTSLENQQRNNKLPFFDPSSRFEAGMRSLEQPWRTNLKLIMTCIIRLFSLFVSEFRPKKMASKTALPSLETSNETTNYHSSRFEAGMRSLKQPWRMN